MHHRSALDLRATLALPAALAVLLLAPLASAQSSTTPEPLEQRTHPDEGLMIAGATVFLGAVTAGVAILMPLELSSCVEPGRDSSLPPDHGYAMCSQAPLSAIPFAHLVGGGAASLIAGPILLVAEIIGLFTFIGGAAHHHPDTAPSARTGDVTVGGVAGADIGLSLSLHL